MKTQLKTINTEEGQTQACESRMDPQITGDIFRLGLGRDSSGTQMLLLTELASDWHKRSYRRWSHQLPLPHSSWCPCPLLCDFAISPSHTHTHTCLGQWGVNRMSMSRLQPQPQEPSLERLPLPWMNVPQTTHWSKGVRLQGQEPPSLDWAPPGSLGRGASTRRNV